MSSATQTETGRAFEWAVGKAVTDLVGCQLVDSNFSRLAKLCYEEKISDKKRNAFDVAAELAVRHILVKEKIARDPSATLEFNSDRAGQKGDVRDVILKYSGKSIGISCKSNHEALKHSRLSAKLDFISKWDLNDEGCSPEYWDQIKPIFAELASIRKKSDRKALWEDLEKKPERFYWPLLDAWEQEINRAISANPAKEADFCKRLMTYLIGNFDFYKVMCKGSKRVEIQAFNFSGNLSTRKTNFPTVINVINKKNGGVYSKTIVFNRGFSINFRIHNASSRVEASLKFDINAIGLPSGEVYQHTLDIAS
jgi:hypothetical protein